MKGMLVGIRKELKVEKVKVKKRNGLIEVALKVKGRKWNVIGVYVRRDLEKKLEELNKWMERKEENGCILIGGDFNARTGEEGRVISKGYEEEEGVGRRSKDKRINKEGKELLRWIEKAGWTIFNECTKGDVEGEWTYTGRSGNSKNIRDRIKQMMVGGCASKGVRRERGWWDSKCKEGKIIVRRDGKNKGRRKRKVNENITMEEWDKYFRNLLGGGLRAKMDEEEGISRSEMRAVMGRLKDNKAVGADGIPSEVWKYGGENVEEWIWKISNRIWKGEGWIDEWNERVIVPILKKGEGERVEEYRGCR
ncbi:hypothetical protein ACFW04_011519 [Cataglyphis niger]